MVSRTGWLWEYIDGLCLAKALQLLEYWRREAAAQAKAFQKAREGKQEHEFDTPEFIPMSEEQAAAQMGMLPRSSVDQIGVSQGSRMNEDQRDMVRWAEEHLKKMSIN